DTACRAALERYVGPVRLIDLDAAVVAEDRAQHVGVGIAGRTVVQGRQNATDVLGAGEPSQAVLPHRIAHILGGDRQRPGWHVVHYRTTGLDIVAGITPRVQQVVVRGP